MIQFNNLNQEMPYRLIKAKYDEAFNSGQKGIEAISVSSFNTIIQEVITVNIHLILLQKLIT